jgi:hypothetical protein
MKSNSHASEANSPPWKWSFLAGQSHFHESQSLSLP